MDVHQVDRQTRKTPGLGLPHHSADQLRPEAVECVDGMHIGEFDARRQQLHDVFERAAGGLLQHGLVDHHPGDGIAFEREVMLENDDEFFVVECKLIKALMQVEQVAILGSPGARP